MISSHTRSGKEPAPPLIQESLPLGSGQKPALTSANASLLRIRAKLEARSVQRKSLLLGSGQKPALTSANANLFRV